MAIRSAYGHADMCVLSVGGGGGGGSFCEKATSMISTLKLGFANMQLEAAAVAKKCMVFLASLQEEINLCMKDTGEKLKQYTADQLGFAKAKEKLDKEEEKGKAGKKSDKLKEKMELAWKKVQNSRNDYLLALQTLNVQQDRYFKIELDASEPNTLSPSLSLPAFRLPPSLPFCFHPGRSGNIRGVCVCVWEVLLLLLTAHRMQPSRDGGGMAPVCTDASRSSLYRLWWTSWTPTST